MSRLIMIAAVLGIAIGLPYFASQPSKTNTSLIGATPTGASLGAPITSTAVPQLAGPGTGGATLPIQGPGSLIYASPAPLEGAKIQAVDQVLRFDVTKDWVYRTWSRKSTGPTDVGLFAVRVPLVSGTHVGALAGSLTYYFNSIGQVEHIAFYGRTGDTTPLVNFLVRTYEFQRAEAPVGEQFYQVKRGRRIHSELRTRPESVLWATSPHGSIAVELELARPGSNRVLPPRAPVLDIPQVASSAPAADAASDGASSDSGGSPYLDKMRYATPQEQGQVLWKRWPN
jgi:hypothetical protein